MRTLRDFIGTSQMKVLRQLCRGEEGEWYLDKMREMAGIVRRMPKTYETDGQGDSAVAVLHYFASQLDFWLVEKDADPDGEGQMQAFGLVEMGDYPELGYICLPEILGAGAELDLHWTPKTIGEIRGEQNA